MMNRIVSYFHFDENIHVEVYMYILYLYDIIWKILLSYHPW